MLKYFTKRWISIQFSFHVCFFGLFCLFVCFDFFCFACFSFVLLLCLDWAMKNTKISFLWAWEEQFFLSLHRKTARKEDTGRANNCSRIISYWSSFFLICLMPILAPLSIKTLVIRTIWEKKGVCFKQFVPKYCSLFHSFSPLCFLISNSVPVLLIVFCIHMQNKSWLFSHLR